MKTASLNTDEYLNSLWTIAHKHMPTSTPRLSPSTYFVVKQRGCCSRFIFTALEIAGVIDTSDNPEPLGVSVDPSAADAFWSVFLRSLKPRGRGTRLFKTKPHERLEAAPAKSRRNINKARGTNIFLAL